MAIIRVYATGGNDADDGSTWDLAKATLGAAVTAATGDGDIIYVHKTHTEDLAGDTNYTFANNVRVICVDKDNADALATMGESYYIGHGTSNRSITIAGAYNLYFYGITFRTAGSTLDLITIGNTDGQSSVWENCYLWSGNTNDSAYLRIGGTDAQTSVVINGGTLRFNSNTIAVALGGSLECYGVTTIGTCTCLIKAAYADPGGTSAVFEGCDLSSFGSDALVGDDTVAASRYRFSNCKLGASYAPLAAQTVANKSGAEVWLFNCYSGDEHIHLAHHNALGETTCSTGGSAIYATSNICDANLSWRIVGTANATFYLPYKSPWIDVYHTGTSAITPSLECVRSGSSSAYNNDTLWSEWSYQGTSGYPQAVFVTSDRMTPLGSAAAQTTGALGAGDWSGENATSWFGKLAPAAAFTPAEVGHIRARVCIVGANTIYVDPQIRGLS